MAHGEAGIAVAVLADGTAVNLKVTSWDVEEKVNLIRDTGAGDVAESRLAGHLDWEATVEGWVLGGTERSVINAGEAKFGTVVALSLKDKSGDATARYLMSGIADNLKVHADALSTDPVKGTFHAVCSEGVAPTRDTSPT